MPIRVLLAKSEGLASNHQLAMSSCPVFTVGLSSGVVQLCRRCSHLGMNILGTFGFGGFGPFSGKSVGCRFTMLYFD